MSCSLKDWLVHRREEERNCVIRRLRFADIIFYYLGKDHAKTFFDLSEETWMPPENWMESDACCRHCPHSNWLSNWYCTLQYKCKTPKGALPMWHWLNFGSRTQVLTCSKSQAVLCNTSLITTTRHSSKRFRKRKGRIRNWLATPVHILGYLQQSTALGDIYLHIWKCK